MLVNTEYLSSTKTSSKKKNIDKNLRIFYFIYFHFILLASPDNKYTNT